MKERDNLEYLSVNGSVISKQELNVYDEFRSG
jgi:hypothetical protein